MSVLLPKSLYNPQGVPSLEETIIGCQPTGLLNFSKSRYKWAARLYKSMRMCYWIPDTVDTTSEKKAYQRLSPEDKAGYDKVFSSLNFIDSLLADSLGGNLSPYITNKVLNANLAEQGGQEALHSRSYAVLLDDTVGNSEEVFNLYKQDLKLNAKNTAIGKMFAKLRTVEAVLHYNLPLLESGELPVGEFIKIMREAQVTPEKIFYAMIANQLVEGIFFQTGFATIYYLGAHHGMLASADMIKEIHKDELHHLALFEHMIKEFTKENPDLLWFQIRNMVNGMFDKAYAIESAHMHDVLGHRFSREITDATVAYFIKARMKAIGMYDKVGDPYGFAKRTPLVIALKQREMANDTRTNFFEGTVANYSKKELDWEVADDAAEVAARTTAQPSYEDAVNDKNKTQENHN